MPSNKAAAFITGNGDPKWGDSTLGTGAEVTYSFSLGNETITEGGEQVSTVPLNSIFPAGYELEIERALIMWAAHGNLDFRRVQDGLFGSAVDIAISAHPRGPEDNYLAHAGLPLAGDAHFASNLSGPWGFIDAEPGPHILTTAAHEFGHSLGLLHAGPANQGTSIMQGGGLFTDGTHQTIWQDNIDAMHFLYGPAGGTTWDPGFSNAIGNWNDGNRWFTNVEPDVVTDVSVFNGNLVVTSENEQAANLRLGGMSESLIRMLGAGSLEVAGETNIRFGGSLAMLGGSMTTATLDLTEGGTLVQRVGATPFNHLEVLGEASLSNSTLEVSAIGGFDYTSGDLFRVLTADSITGEFDTIIVPSLDSTWSALVDYGDDYVDLFVVTKGDVNLDGSLTVADWVVVKNNLFKQSTAMNIGDAYSNGDLNRDGKINELDFGLFKEFYEQIHGVGSFEAATQNIPEPTAYSLLLTSLLLVSAKPDRRWRLRRRLSACSLH